MKNARYKILHDFQSSDKLALGTDYSYNYIEDNGIMLHFYYDDEVGNSSLSFKTFLESFSMNFSVDYGDDSELEANLGSPKDFTINYDLKLKIPSISLNDARVNAARLEELNSLISPKFANFQGESVSTTDSLSLRVLLSNLIHNGKYKKQHLINTTNLIRKYGLRCFISDVNFSGDVGLGYFEGYDKLFFKSYDLSLKLQVFLSTDDEISNKIYIIGFSDTGYDSDDIKTWPFGVL